MKHVLFITTLFFFFTSANFAQKIKTKNIPIKYTQLPYEPLQGDFKSYSVRVIDEDFDLSKHGFSNSSMKAMFNNLSQFELVPSKQDLTIKVTLYGKNLVNRADKSYEITEGSGDNKKTVTRWQTTLSLRAPISYEILDAAGNIMREGDIRKPDNIVKVKKHGFTTKRKLIEFLYKNQHTIITKKVAELVKNDIKAFTNTLKAQIDTYEISRSVQIHTIKKASNFGMEEFDKHLELAQTTLEKQLFQKQHLAKLKSSIEFWKSNLTKYNPKDKKQKEAFYASASSLGNLYLLNNNIETAKVMLKKMEQTESHKVGINNFRLAIDRQERALNKNRNIEKQYQNYEQAQTAGKVVKINNESNNGSKRGWVETDNMKVQGEIQIITKTTQIGAFGEGQSVAMVIVNQSEGPTLKIKPYDIKEMELDGTQILFLEVFPFYTIALERLKFNKSAVLYKDFLAAPPATTYVIYTASGKILVPKLTFNINKTAIKKFGTCTTVKSNAEEKGYSKKRASLEQMIDDLNTCELETVKNK